MTDTITPTVYAGDNVPTTLDRDRHMLVRDALLNSQFLAAHDHRKHIAAISVVGGRDLAHGEEIAGPQTAQAIEALMDVIGWFSLSGYEGSEKGEKAVEMVKRALRGCGYRHVSRGDRSGYLAHDIWFIARPEDLDHYMIPKWLDGKIERIEEIRFFDKSEITHLCSTQGSYWARYQRTEIILKPEFMADDDLLEKARDWLDDAVRGVNEDDYIDEGSTDRFIERNAPGTVYHWGNPFIDLDEARDTVIDRLQSDVRQRNAGMTIEQAAKFVTEKWNDASLDEQVTHFVLDKVGEAESANTCI